MPEQLFSSPLAMPNEEVQKELLRHPEETLLGNSPFGIIGQEEVVLGFKALGFKPYCLKEPGEFKRILPEVAKSNVAVCLVEENIYRAGQPEIDNYRNLPLPIFIPFSKDTKLALLDSLIKGIRLKATGVV